MYLWCYGVVSVNECECECLDGTRGSGVVYCADNVLEMSVVRDVRGVGGVCEMCICLARVGMGDVGGAWVRGLGLGFTNHVGTGGVWDMGLCLGCGCMGGGVGVGVWSGPASVNSAGGVDTICLHRV